MVVEIFKLLCQKQKLDKKKNKIKNVLKWTYVNFIILYGFVKRRFYIDEDLAGSDFYYFTVLLTTTCGFLYEKEEVGKAGFYIFGF